MQDFALAGVDGDWVSGNCIALALMVVGLNDKLVYSMKDSSLQQTPVEERNRFCARHLYMPMFQDVMLSIRSEQLL